jgi:hypothetical protein
MSIILELLFLLVVVMRKISEAVILKTKKSSHGLIELRSDNILVFRPDLATFKQYSIQVLEDLRKDFLEITDGVPRPYMCDNRHISILVGKAEKDYINKHFNEFATDMAMVTHSPLMKVLLNGFNTLFKPKFEIRLFRAEQDAVNWLLDSTKI